MKIPDISGVPVFSIPFYIFPESLKCSFNINKYVMGTDVESSCPL